MLELASGLRAPLRRIAFIAVLAAMTIIAAVAGRPAVAAAGGPGTWTNISGPVGSLLVQPDTARGSGGALHVVWSVYGTPQYFKYRQISANGTAGGAANLTPGGWPSLSNRPAIVGVPSGGTTDLLAFAGGISPGLSPTYEGLVSWLSNDNGASFLSTPALVSADGNAYGSDVSAVAVPGSLFETWAGSVGVFVHQGETPSPSAVNVNDVGNYGYNPAFGYDALSGRLFVVAEYNATGKEGLWFRRIDPSTGSIVGSSVALDKSWSTYSGTRSFDLQDIRTPVAGLVGRSAVIVAYPTGYPSATTLRVWRITPDGSGSVQSTAVLASGGSSKSATAVAADPNGRAWVVWTDTSGTRRHVYARRSNVGATAWGQTVSVLGPSGTGTLWQLAANAQAGRVDVLGQFSNGAGSSNTIYHTQLLAGLSVTVSPAKAKAGKAFTAKVTVKDAGSPVGGAKVKVGVKSATTNASGVARLKVTSSKAGKLPVTVTKSGYGKGSASVTIKH
jgi:hypothetical protein